MSAGPRASALGAIRPITPAAVDALARTLHDKHAAVQHEAAKALGKLGRDAVPAVPTLADMLKSRAMYVRGHPGECRPVAETAAQALGAIGPSAKSAMPALLGLLRDGNGRFERFGPDDKCDNYEARGEAAIAAARIDPQSDELLHALGQSLQDDAWIRGEVAVALALIGRKAQGQVPSLLRFARPNSESGYALTCACAAVVIESENSATLDKMLAPVQMNECLPLLSRLSGDEDWALLRTALRRAGGFSRPAILILNKMLEDPWANRQDAARALRGVRSRGSGCHSRPARNARQLVGRYAAGGCRGTSANRIRGLRSAAGRPQTPQRRNSIGCGRSAGALSRCSRGGHRGAG